MKRAYQSVMIKKKDMTDAENQCVLADIETYNRMKHTALVWNNQNRVFEDERSIHLHLKDRYGCNDYFANSANREAKALISSQMELREMYLADIHDDIKAIKKQIKKKEKYLKTLTDTKESLVWYTASGCSNPKKIKDCPNVRFMEDGRVRVQVFKKKTFFDNLYLFEHTWLEPKIREVKNNIRQMEHKIGRLGKKARALQEDPLVHVCFGTKKLFHDTRICGEDRVRALHKKRYSRMMVSGRHDSKNGNWVFTYDTQTGDLWYRSMTDWNGKKIRFPGVFFPYGQEQVCSYLNNRKGAVAWGIRDCGNAWQITCVISVEEERRNDCFVDGCIAYDINYDNIAWSELDGCGNLLHHGILPLTVEEKTSGQMQQQRSHALEKIFRYARDVKKPIVCENIKAVKRKKFYDKNTKRTRHISLFASDQFALLAASKTEKYGVSVTPVNPAYTSLTGKLKYKKRYGMTTHEAAAFVIGRRGMGFFDTVPKDWKCFLTDKQKTGSRKKQWAALYKTIKKMDYRQVNQLLYPRPVSDDFLYATSL